MRNKIRNYKKYSTNQPSQKWHSPWRYTPDTSINSSKKQNKLFTKFPIKGISVLSFFKSYSCKSGSMTIEAAIVLPLFLFFFINLLWIIEIYRLHSTLLSALRETGYRLAVYGYAYDAIVDEEDDSGLEAIVENIVFSELFVRNQIEKLVGEEFLENSPLTYGKKGLLFFETSLLQQNDIIDLVLVYQVSPFIDIAGFLRTGLYTRYYGRAWTGYDVEQNDSSQNEQVVFVAQNGIVYHTDKACTYISLTIEEVSAFLVNHLRNEYGSSYRPCDICVVGNSGKTVYVTKSGDCFHLRRNCSGLSRYIFHIPYNEAKQKYKKCSRCGR